MNNIVTITGQEISFQKFCINCNAAIAADSRFCKNCGYAQTNETLNVFEQKWSAVKQVAIFFLLQAVICCVASFIDYFKTVEWSIIADFTLAIISIAFFCYNWSANKSLLLWRNFSLSKLLLYCVVAVIGSLIVNFIVDWLNISLYSKEVSYYAFYRKHSYGKELMIFFVAVMPALFEELGYRGFLMQKLLILADKKQAIFISAFLFAIMHTSFISLFWLIPFALLLAYIRIKENTLWYGVCMHFSFNFTVCLLEFYRFGH